MAYTEEQLREALKNAVARGDQKGAKLIDEELQALSAMSTDWKDIGKSAATGYGNTLLGLIGGAAAAKVGLDPRLVQRGVEKELGYQPKTVKGEYAKNIGTGASFGPGGVPAAVAGGVGGALAKFAERHGYGDPYSQIAAWLVPSFLLASYKGLHPGAAQKDARRILRETTPQDLSTARQNVFEAGAREVDMPVWQGAPVESPLYQAGAQVVQHPAAEQGRRMLAAQQGLGNQQWVDKVAGPAMDAIAPTSVPPAVLEAVRKRIEKVAAQRHLMPDTPDYNAVRAAEGRFRIPQTTPPTVRTVGQVHSYKQSVGTPDFSEFQGAGAATRGAVRQAIDEGMDAVPGYTPTKNFYGRTKDIAEIMARDAGLRGSAGQSAPRLEAKLGAVPTATRAAATSTAWSIVPKVSDIAESAVARKLDAALASRDLRALERIAGEHPQWEAAITLIAQAIRSGTATPSLELEATLKRYLPDLPRSK